jgi:hypothetical protein
MALRASSVFHPCPIHSIGAGECFLLLILVGVFGEWVGNRDVVTLLNAGRGKVKLYAKALNLGLCPKYLKAKRQLYYHGSNHSMVMVVEVIAYFLFPFAPYELSLGRQESHPACTSTSFRLFTRCFSEKCRAMVCPHCAGGWMELSRCDYLLMQAVQAIPRPKTSLQDYLFWWTGGAVPADFGDGDRGPREWGSNTRRNVPMSTVK